MSTSVNRAIGTHDEHTHIADDDEGAVDVSPTASCHEVRVDSCLATLRVVAQSSVSRITSSAVHTYQRVRDVTSVHCALLRFGVCRTVNFERK